jgi:ergothioneine biosynthesis protein EgtB
MNNLEKYKESLEGAATSRDHLVERFISVRKHSTSICENLENEDLVVQPSQEVSPPKWHLGHTTWFFEEMILVQFSNNFTRFDENYRAMFNSYYKAAGKHWVQGDRGHLSRPTVNEVLVYRNYIDEKVVEFLRTSELHSEVRFLIEVGLHHEQQHQELLLMDIKYILGSNPITPTYTKSPLPESKEVSHSWKEYQEGIYEVGNDNLGFAFDNEGPRHRSYLYPFAIRRNVVSNGEYLKFIKDGGYSSPKWWLSEGWDWVNNTSISNPLYWQQINNEWFEFSLHGLNPLDLNAPVTHISYFEADAFANWTDLRLPIEQEIEVFLNEENREQKDEELFHPTQTGASVGQVWCWTKSHYSSYPGFKTFKGMLGEYNGKFMCNQFVLRGGCVATPWAHYRNSYRNFYQPHQRWMFSGIRLVKDI